MADHLTFSHGNKSAYYVQGLGRKFVSLDDDGSISTTSCPHAATLFTSKTRADSICEQLNKSIAEAHMPSFKFGVFPTRTHNPNVIVGDGL